MMDPKRLLDGEGSPFEQSLLDAAGKETPSPALENVMRQALGLPSITLPSAPSTPPPAALAPTSSATLSGSLWLKVLGVAAVLGASGALVFGLGGSDPQRPAGDAPAKQLAPSAEQQPKNAGQGQPSESAGNAAAAAREEPAAALPADATSAQKSAPRAQSASAEREARLREEIGLIDGMRSALAKNDAELALSRYQSYVARFPTGTLREEADALRVEATRRAGNAKQAESLAKSFERKHPESPHLDRVRAASSATPSTAEAPAKR